MNDRFKVRAWIIAEKRMIDCVEVSPLHVGDCDRGRWKQDEVVLMQCAGLKDDGETPIMEGDILECVCPEGTVVAVVEFENPNGTYSWGWQLRKLKGDDFNMDILLWVETELSHMDCMIIGNRYENPELMDGNNG